jgi:hypothetical protein
MSVRLARSAFLNVAKKTSTFVYRHSWNFSVISKLSGSF